MNAASPYQSVPVEQIEIDIREATETAMAFRQTGNHYRYMHHAERVHRMRRELTVRTNGRAGQ